MPMVRFGVPEEEIDDEIDDFNLEEIEEDEDDIMILNVIEATTDETNVKQDEDTASESTTKMYKQENIEHNIKNKQKKNKKILNLTKHNKNPKMEVHSEEVLTNADREGQNTESELKNTKIKLENTKLELLEANLKYKESLEHNATNNITREEFDKAKGERDATRIELENNQSELQESSSKLKENKLNLLKTKNLLKSKYQEIKDIADENDKIKNELVKAKSDLENNDQLDIMKSELGSTKHQLETKIEKLENTESELWVVKNELENSRECINGKEKHIQNIEEKLQKLIPITKHLREQNNTIEANHQQCSKVIRADKDRITALENMNMDNMSKLENNINMNNINMSTIEDLKHAVVEKENKIGTQNRIITALGNKEQRVIDLEAKLFAKTKEAESWQITQKKLREYFEDHNKKAKQLFVEKVTEMEKSEAKQLAQVTLLKETNAKLFADECKRDIVIKELSDKVQEVTALNKSLAESATIKKGSYLQLNDDISDLTIENSDLKMKINSLKLSSNTKVEFESKSMQTDHDDQTNFHNIGGGLQKTVNELVIKLKEKQNSINDLIESDQISNDENFKLEKNVQNMQHLVDSKSRELSTVKEKMRQQRKLIKSITSSLKKKTREKKAAVEELKTVQGEKGAACGALSDVSSAEEGELADSDPDTPSTSRRREDRPRKRSRRSRSRSLSSSRSLSRSGMSLSSGSRAPAGGSGRRSFSPVPAHQ